MYEKYVDDVLGGYKLEGELRKLVVQRHYDDLKRQNTEAFPYHFCDKSAQYAIDVISTFRHTKGREFKGRLWDMRPFQAFNYAMTFGWKNEDGYRKYREVYEEVAKKSAKSERVAAVMVFMGLFDGEESAELYAVATRKAQTKYIFRAIKQICKYLRIDNREFRKIVKVMTEEVRILDSDSFITTMTGDPDEAEGSAPHCVGYDEYHLQMYDEMKENLSSASASLLQALLYIITTAGTNIYGPCYELRMYCVDVLRGLYKDESILPFIHAFDDEEAEWQNEEMWCKTNPMIGVTPTWDFMRKQYTTAINRGGSKLRRFKTKNLNIWLKSSSDYIQHKWIEASWDDSVTLERLRGRRCFLGVDLASDYDIAAVSSVFPPIENDPHTYIIRKYFICDDAAKERTQKDKTKYLDWIDDGYLINTGGDVTDFEYIEEYITKIGAICKIIAAAFDNWNSSQTRVRLHSIGLQHVAIAQGAGTLNNGTRHLRTIHRTHKVKTPRDPVYAWMMSHVELFTDVHGNEKPDKGKSREKIDGVIADVNALTLYLNPDKYKDIPDIGTGFHFPK